MESKAAEDDKCGISIQLNWNDPKEIKNYKYIFFISQIEERSQGEIRAIYHLQSKYQLLVNNFQTWFGTFASSKWKANHLKYQTSLISWYGVIVEKIYLILRKKKGNSFFCQ